MFNTKFISWLRRSIGTPRPAPVLKWVTQADDRPVIGTGQVITYAHTAEGVFEIYWPEYGDSPAEWLLLPPVSYNKPSEVFWTLEDAQNEALKLFREKGV